MKAFFCFVFHRNIVSPRPRFSLFIFFLFHHIWIKKNSNIFLAKMYSAYHILSRDTAYVKIYHMFSEKYLFFKKSWGHKNEIYVNFSKFWDFPLIYLKIRSWSDKLSFDHCLLNLLKIFWNIWLRVLSRVKIPSKCFFTLKLKSSRLY